MRYFLGIDIGGTAVKFGLFSENDILLEKWSIDTDTTEDGSSIIPKVAISILDFFGDKNIDNLSAIGLALPGPTVNGNIIKKAINLGWKKEINVVKEFNACLKKNICTYALNDANAAAFGEYKYGAGKGFDDVFMVTIGTGIGGGLILDGKVIEGRNGGVGEIGHVSVVDKYERKCNCGGTSCLESIAGSDGILWLYGQKSGKECKNITVKDICDKAKDGDKEANDTLRESMGYIGKALSIVSVLVEPKCMIVGGGVSNAGDIIVDYIKDGYNKYCTMTTVKPEFRLAKLINDAGIYGAMSMAKSKM